MNQTTMISISVRILPSNQEVDVDLPLSVTARELIGQLLAAGLKIPLIDGEGNRISYMLLPKGGNREVEENETLGSAGVQDGDVLLLMPNLVAGRR